MAISDVAIRNHVFTWMLMAALLLFGFLGLSRMGISLYPDVDYPVASIGVSYPGAAPEVMEKDVIEPIESAISTLPGIKKVTSSMRRGQGSVDIEFELDQDIDVMIQELVSRLSRAQRDLPDQMDPPTISKSNPEDRPIMYVAVESETLERRELMMVVRERIQDYLAATPGVSEADIFGYVEPAIRVDLKPEKLRFYELSPLDVLATIQREHVELPAGSIRTPLKEEAIRVKGEIERAETLQKVPIIRRGASYNFLDLKLESVADIYAGLDEVQRLSRVDGKPAVALGIRKQRGANAVQVADRIYERLAVLNKNLPPGVKVGVNFDNTQFVREAVSELLFTMVLSALLTAFVCFLFLGSLKATFNILLAIPTSILGSFIVLKALDFTLNTFTLLALSLAIGIVVDDAIIMLENIFRHQKRTGKRKEGARLGAREISFAVLATTAALVAIFLPVAYMDGVIGRYFFEFGLAISVAVILSSLEALTLTPMRLSRFGAEGGRGGSRFRRAFDGALDALAQGYVRLLSLLLRHRLLTLGGSLLALAAIVYGAMGIPFEFAPDQDEGRSFTILKTAEGSSLEFTDQLVAQVEKEIKGLPFVERYYVSVGGFGGGGRTNMANMIVFFDRPGERAKDPETGKPYDLKGVKKAIDAAVGRVEGIRGFTRVSFSQSLGGRGGDPVEFVIKGGSFAGLQQETRSFMEWMEQEGSFVGIRSDQLEQIPEIHIVPDREKTQRFGVDVLSVAQVINIAFNGVEAGEYTEGSRRYPIIIRLPESRRDDLSHLTALKLRNGRGEMVELVDLVSVVNTTGPLQIFRDDRERGITVTSGLTGKISQAQALQLIEKEASTRLSEGYYLDFSGSSEGFFEAFVSLGWAMLLGVIVAYMVLAAQFNSFRDPLTILLGLPFSLAGALLTLRLTGQSINIYSMIGLILLVGLAKKNGILLVEFTNQLRDQGRSKLEALLEAGRLRLRPILMTTFATVASAIPAAVNFGPGAETRIPMALCVIGGMLLATPLALVLVPVGYSLISGERESEQSQTPAEEKRHLAMIP